MMINIRLSIFFLVLPISAALASQESLLLTYDPMAPVTESKVFLEAIPTKEVPVAQIHFRTGERTLQDLKFSNDYYNFKYPQSNATTFDIGWESAPLTFFGHWGTKFDLGFASYENTLSQKVSDSQTSMKLYLVPISYGFVYFADQSSLAKSVFPVFEAGVDYNIFFQRGDLDGSQKNGGAWTYHGSIGLRHNLGWAGFNNTQLSFDYKKIIAVNSSQIAFDGTSYLLGLAFKL